MKQIRKKIKLIMHYIPSCYYDEKDNAFFFLKVNNGKRYEIHLDKSGNKTDMTYNELIGIIKEELEKEIENDN